MRVFSFGGGVQSMAVLVLVAQQRVQYDHFLFCNVGHDSENPATLRYVEEVAKPYAVRHGIDLVELQRTRRDGTPETLYGRIASDAKSMVIPVYMRNGMPASRSCTSDFKIRVIAKWLKQHGATPAAPAVTGLGISVDELERAKTDSGIAWQTLEYPLLDLRLARHHCAALIRDAGLPVPPKSSCWFCPFTKLHEWRHLRQNDPALWRKAVEVEQMINGKNSHGPYTLHRSGVPLDRAVGDQTDMFAAFEDDFCDTGSCLV